MSSPLLGSQIYIPILLCPFKTCLQSAKFFGVLVKDHFSFASGSFRADTSSSHILNCCIPFFTNIMSAKAYGAFLDQRVADTRSSSAFTWTTDFCGLRQCAVSIYIVEHCFFKFPASSMPFSGLETFEKQARRRSTALIL